MYSSWITAITTLASQPSFLLVGDVAGGGGCTVGGAGFAVVDTLDTAVDHDDLAGDCGTVDVTEVNVVAIGDTGYLE